jgi:hypothetical protein
MPIMNTLTLIANLVNTQNHFEKYKTLTNKLINDAIISRETIAELETEIEVKLKSPEWDEIRNWFETRQEETTTSSSTSLRYTATIFTTPALSTSIRLVAICVMLVIKSLHC